MRQLIPFAAGLGLLLAGCALIGGDGAKQPVEDSKLPYPKAVYVYDFAVSPAEVSSGSAAAQRLSGAIDDPAKTDKRDAIERQIADQVAGKLVAQLQKLGLPAVRWRGTPPLNQDAYTLEGQFLTIGDTGAPDQKVIGFGLGGTELRVLAQAYYLDGRRKMLLGEAEVSAQSSQAPGLAAALPTPKLSASRAAASVATGLGVVRTVNKKVRAGAEETAAAIVEQLKPQMQEQGWF